MKIERECHDIDIEKLIEEGAIRKMVNDEGICSLNIKITDPVKATNFLLQFALAGKSSVDLDEKCGFKIVSVNNFMAKDITSLVDSLEKCLDFLSNTDLYPGYKLE